MHQVIEKYKTGFSIPSDVPFEDVTSSNHNKSMNNIYGTVAGSMSRKDKKRPGLVRILGAKVSEFILFIIIIYII